MDAICSPAQKGQVLRARVQGGPRIQGVADVGGVIALAVQKSKQPCCVHVDILKRGLVAVVNGNAMVAPGGPDLHTDTR